MCFAEQLACQRITDWHSGKPPLRYYNTIALLTIKTYQGTLLMSLTGDPQTSPYDYYWQPRRYLLISILAPMLLFLALICAVELTARQEQMHQQHLSHEQLMDKTNQVRTQLEYELNSTLHLTTSLVSYIQSKRGILVAQEIDPWLTNLQDRARYMRNIGIAPDNTITYIFPVKGNEAALGLHYPDNKEQWSAIQKVIYSRRPILAGPVHLQQGGLGLVYRVPVFLDDKNYWGLVSTVLNFDQIYEVIHTRAQQMGIKFAIKDADNYGKILFGDKDVIANAEINLSIPGRNWQIISNLVTPTSSSVLSPLHIAGWLIALIISILFNSFLRSLALQNKALHKLHESKHRFSKAFDRAPQSIVLINRHGKIIDFNTSLCTLLGYAYAELESQHFFLLATPDQRDRLTNIIEGIYPNSGANHQYESVLLHSSGQLISVIISMAPTQAGDKESDWIVQIVDINHRIAFEQLLQDEVSYNQSILDAVMDGIMIMDTNGNIRSANPAACAIFGCAQDQFINQHINQFICDPESGSIMRYIQYPTGMRNATTPINHQVNGNKVSGLKVTGNEFPIELQLACIQRKQEKLFIAVVRDLSEKSKLISMTDGRN